MTDSEWDLRLAEAAGEVLETMFFTDVCGLAPPGGSASQPRLAAHISFLGTPSGALTISISESAVRGLAANFLASEQDEPIAPAQLEGVVCELANMLCGSVLSGVKTEERFRLSSPELLPASSACPPRAPNRSLAVSEGGADGTIDLWLSLEPHAN